MNCFECGSNASAGHDHHVVPRVLGGTKTVRLCVACHGLIHGIDFTKHSELTERGHKAARARGVWFGVPPFGYRKNPWGGLERDEAAQAIIAWIRVARDARTPWRAITAKLGGTRDGWRRIVQREELWEGHPPNQI